MMLRHILSSYLYNRFTICAANHNWKRLILGQLYAEAKEVAKYNQPKGALSACPVGYLDLGTIANILLTLGGRGYLDSGP